MPGQRGADPGRQERGAGAGVRRRAGVEPDGAGGGGAEVHGAGGEARHRVPGGEAVKIKRPWIASAVRNFVSRSPEPHS
jgi:hypothetical protein